MGGRKHAADGSCETVYGSESGVRKRQAAEQACDRHVVTRIWNVTQFVSPLKRSGGAPDAFNAQHVCQRIGAEAYERLYQLGKRIESGRRGQRWRQIIS